ncbi:DinB family protein [Nakamurella lactea]|uniref:DinB family protein n=1 Tax=Nakamurella lactea TaxID=459515 RepID=UPI000401B962|nr:DinB family protein [Nakamurella lactea]
MAESETDLLLRCLAGQRRHVLGTLEGLTEEQLHRAVLPSGWNCLGAVRHLALEVEQFWFQGIVAGERVDTDAMDTAWKVGPEVPAETVLQQYREEIAKSNAIISATPLDSLASWWPSEFVGDGERQSLRAIVLHALTDTATHAGQLDAVRELLDGKQWLVLNG